MPAQNRPVSNFPVSSASHASFDAEALRRENLLGRKLAEARRQKKLSQKDVARLFLDYKITISSGAVSKWEKGDALPNPYQFLALCRILGIRDVLESFTGCLPQAEDASPQLNQKGLRLLQLFQETLLVSGDYQVKRRRQEKPSPRSPLPVKVFRLPAAAGSGSFLTGEDYDMMEFDPAIVPKETDFGIRVTGDSMLPRYVPGQVVFVEQCRELYDGEIGVFVYNGDAYLKQYRELLPTEAERDAYTTSEGVVLPKIALRSLNRERADCDVDVRPDGTFYLVGRVLN